MNLIASMNMITKEYFNLCCTSCAKVVHWLFWWTLPKTVVWNETGVWQTESLYDLVSTSVRSELGCKDGQKRWIQFDACLLNVNFKTYQVESNLLISKLGFPHDYMGYMVLFIMIHLGSVCEFSWIWFISYESLSW